MRRTQVGGGRSARFHLWCLKLARWILKPIGFKGLGRSIARIGRLFPRGGYVDVPIGRASTIRVDLDDAYWLGPLMKGAGYEPEVEVALARFLRPGTAFIDCGANIGYWSVIAAERITDLAHVIAVEASPFLVERLRVNAALNADNFQVLHAAVWRTAGETIRLATDRDRHSWGSVSPSVTAELRREGFQTMEVSTTTLDAVTQAVNAQRFIVKLDVEGAEIQALEGARRLCETDVLFIFEQHSRDTGRTASAFLEAGFRIFTVVGEGAREIRDVNQIEAVPTGEAWNLLACRDQSSFATEINQWSANLPIQNRGSSTSMR